MRIFASVLAFGLFYGESRQSVFPDVLFLHVLQPTLIENSGDGLRSTDYGDVCSEIAKQAMEPCSGSSQPTKEERSNSIYYHHKCVFFDAAAEADR